jgi:antitoxin HicB
MFQGPSEGIADARAMALDALEVMLNDYVEEGKDLHAVKAKRGKHAHWIEPSSLAQLKLALFVEFRKARISRTELARKMGIAKQQIDRLFDLRYSSRVEQLEAAFHAIGKTIAISVENEAAAAEVQPLVKASHRR